MNDLPAKTPPRSCRAGGWAVPRARNGLDESRLGLVRQGSTRVDRAWQGGISTFLYSVR